MKNLSEDYIKLNCPHCDPKSQAFKYLLEETEDFRIVCDCHPILEGHILIIPKAHLVCIGEYPAELYNEFLQLYEKYQSVIKLLYGKVSTFEHGKLGQTVFHSHIHILPFAGNPNNIVPEGPDKYQKIFSLDELKNIYKTEGGYLFFSIESDKWLVDIALAAPRFFRDRFAKALGRPDRGNWKIMHENKEEMVKAEQEVNRFMLKLKENIKMLV